jgi:cell division protein FtsW (lipid II flippase)
VISPFPAPSGSTTDRIQGRLLSLAALFLLFQSLQLTLAPAVRMQSWQVNLNWLHWLGFAVWLALFVFAHRQTVRFLPDRDPYLLPLTALLSGWGMLTIWRLSPNLGFRQTLWLALAVILTTMIIRLPDALAYLRRYKYLWLVSGLLLTGLTFIFGVYPGGSGPHLWLGCCGVYLQPSEPLKLLLVAYLAVYLADRLPSRLTLLQFVLPSVLISGLALLILLAQRDLGTASLFFFLYAAILYVATNRWRILVISALVVILAGLAGYGLFDVVHLRVDAWINPWLDPSGRSFQIVQSLMAVANGSILGRGTGLGSPSLVPVAHSDFIFSAISEESGLLGSAALAAMLGLLAVRGLRAALRAPKVYSRFLAAGLSAYLAGQSLLIIAGNLRLLPLTGVTLPFVSYGGSSLVTSFLAITLLLVVSSQANQDTPVLAKPLPYWVLAGALLVGCLAIPLASGWWSVWRGPDLQARNDNPRRSVNDRFVRRGSLLDRSGLTLAGTTGAPGSYTRQVDYPPLSPVLGYTHPTFGQAALEASLDPYLRGLTGRPLSEVWLRQLLYGQSPPGLDVRLSLSLPLQKKADDLLGSTAGAVILMNAQTGEILVMASHPTYDANTLDKDFDALVKDPHFPLLNRATQGLYPPGAILAPFLLADAYSRGPLPNLPESLTYTLNGKVLTCSLPVSSPYTWEQIIALGCPNALLRLSGALDAGALVNLLTHLGFYNAPALALPVTQPLTPPVVTNIDQYAIGQEGLSVTPLQIVLAAASLSSGGFLPSPRLATGLKTGAGDWVLFPGDNTPAVQVFTPDQARQVCQALVQSDQLTWLGLGLAQNGADQTITWAISGTLPGWQGVPLALVVLLEENNPVLAQRISQELVQSALKP